MKPRFFKSRADFRAWLDAHHADVRELWVGFYKKGSGKGGLAYMEAVDEALCYGWIDGQSKSLDETYSLQRFTPRGKQSKWSKLNRERVARLKRAGRMQPAGLAEVERAKADGRWDVAYASQSKAEVPDDLQAALDAEPAAKAFFATLKGANRYAILYRIHDARTEKTRAARIAKFVSMLALGKTIYPGKS